MSRIEAQSPQGVIQEGQRLMMIKLKKYNKFGELFIGMAAIWSHGHICYQDGVWRVDVTMAAVCMGVKEMGM